MTKAREDDLWPREITIRKALEGSLVRIPYCSDIPRILDVPQDDKSLQAAWVLIVRHLYPRLSWEHSPAVFNRNCYGPQIIYHMIAGVRIEKPVNAKVRTANQARMCFSNHKLLNKVGQAGRMKALGANKEFICTFPKPRSPGQPYPWFAGVECVEEKIKHAAVNTYVKVEGGISGTHEFW